MKNKKIVIIVLLIVIIMAVGFGIFKATHNENYLYNLDGTITDGHKELIEHLKAVEDPIERKKQVDFALENDMITKQEANELKE